ncbi:hypothetical protein [Streptomyces odonnellii]|uniref:hypothetical protein n=1 Tax=Streptomyces odonnellii TaxID=1417980 RepID=UPI001E2B4A5B|nr:hypothetical protein [Streptomyces odonnellii]
MTDVEYEQIAAHFSGDGVYGTPLDPPVITAGIGLTVNVAADVFASLRGHAWTSGTTGDSLDIAANSSGQTRVDRVVLRLDRSTWTVRAVVKQGTPGAGPPVLTTGTGFTTYEALLANATVAAGATSVTVTRGERYVGSRMRPCVSTALTNPNTAPGDLLWEVDTGRILFHDGQALRTIYSASGIVTVDSPLTGWSIGTTSVLEERNGTVSLRLGSFTRTAGTLTNTTPSRLPVLIPADYRHATRDQYIICYITGARIGRITIYSKASDTPGQVWLTQHPGVPTDNNVLSNSGVSWVAG